MQLIIVESPTKAKTISKFLSKEYVTSSSFGHIRDLPIKELGIDVDNNFEPKYIIPAKAKKTVADLKELAEQAEKVILATDEDREGEAIAWHLKKALNLKAEKTTRIAFHEITKEAISQALSKPHPIDENLVNAQQARRVLDRLVGYKLSPFLYKKVAKGLSAGRVQSVAVRLIVDREREIKKFESQEYWSVSAELEKDKQLCQAELNKINGQTINKLGLKEKLAKQAVEDLKKSSLTVSKIETKENSKNPPPPFTTSSLQQTANRQLGFSAKQTMVIAQKLYEQGHITYMRTDSLNLSNNFLTEAKNWLKKNKGEKYYLNTPRRYRGKSKGAQEAHEAIRPTKASQEADNLNPKLDKNTIKLYRLIWQRALASQMPAAKLALSSMEIETDKQANNTYTLRATGQRLIFAGYLLIYPEKTKDQILPNFKEKDQLTLRSVMANQHFTKPPARYSDAGLVKELEKHGIGRPSTYAPTISTIITRNYVIRTDDKRLAPSEISFIVTDLLINHFSKIVDYRFTAEMENNLDEIAAGKKDWVPVIKDFYLPFIDNIKTKDKELKKDDIIPQEKSEEICDKCGAAMIIKTGRYGKFLACSAYPECRNLKKIKKETDLKEDKELEDLQAKHQGKTCDKCGAAMTIKKGRFGPFLACSAFPKCKNIKNLDEGPEIDCPNCKQGKIVKKFSRRGVFYACNNYPDCKNLYNSQPTGQKCSECNSLMITNKGKIICSNKECSSRT